MIALHEILNLIRSRCIVSSIEQDILSTTDYPNGSEVRRTSWEKLISYYKINAKWSVGHRWFYQYDDSIGL